MARATKCRTPPHARFLEKWIHLPAFKALNGNAMKLLICMLADYRPALQHNGKLEWSDARAGKAIGMSEASGRRALADLEDKGWIAVQRFGKFSRDKPTTYALAMWPNDVTGEPATNAFLFWEMPN